MKAIIVGAGRGIRMMPATEHIPKCMMEAINGQRVLDVIEHSLSSGGVDDIVFIGGYRMQKVRNEYPHLRFYENTEWPHNNALESLMFAEPEMNEGFLVSYSDILYGNAAVKQLIASKAEMTLVIDRAWRERYVGRTLKTEEQAEKVIVKDGRVVEIGRHIAPDQAYGEFIGLARFSESGACMLRDRYHEIRASHGDTGFHAAPSIRTAYLSDMLQELIELGVQAEPVDIWGDCAELDTLQDLELARARLNGKVEAGMVHEFWAVRARGYQRLDWTSRKGYLDTFVAAGDFQADDRVLDIGTGTGIVAHAIAPLVSKVIGIDISAEMRAQAASEAAPNEDFEEGNVQGLHFPDNTFDKLTARMVFHHLLDGGKQAMQECYRVLKPGGRMVLSEGVPPDKSLREWYTSMFALKEARLTFFEEDLISLLQSGGFVIERVIEHITPQVSIANWLRNSGLPMKRQNMIMKLHRDLDARGKHYYNMTVTDDDVLCDFKFLILVGCKPEGQPSTAEHLT